MPTDPLQHVAVLGIDTGARTASMVSGRPRAIGLRHWLSRGQVEARLANMAAWLIGMEACVGGHNFSRQLPTIGQDVKLIPAKFVLLGPNVLCSRLQSNPAA
jgi:hypothetical protein